MTRHSRSAAYLQAIAWLVGLALVGGLGGGPLPAAEKPATAELAPLNRFPRMVQEYFVQQVRQAERTADEVRAALKTKADAEKYVETVRRKIRESFGPLPEKTPLNPRVTGVIDRDVYTIEKVIFESRPGFLVTGNLYVPKGRKFPLPGVVGVCGHSANGKAAEAYQSFAQALSRMGYVTLIIDPLGQGERNQYADMNAKPGNGLSSPATGETANRQRVAGQPAEPSQATSPF